MRLILGTIALAVATAWAGILASSAAPPPE